MPLIHAFWNIIIHPHTFMRENILRRRLSLMDCKPSLRCYSVMCLKGIPAISKCPETSLCHLTKKKNPPQNQTNQQTKKK